MQINDFYELKINQELFFKNDKIIIKKIEETENPSSSKFIHGHTISNKREFIYCWDSICYLIGYEPHTEKIKYYRWKINAVCGWLKEQHYLDDFGNRTDGYCQYLPEVWNSYEKIKIEDDFILN